MFNGCSKLNKIMALNKLITNKVRDMKAMFCKCKELEYLDISNFDTSNVTDVSGMFSGCNKLKEIIGINNFSLNNVINMQGLFQVLAGDHCQLPPTVKSMEALKGGLGKTLMERIVENKPECVSLLQVQYRMNDEIMQFSNGYFYHGQMRSAPEVAHRLIHAGDAPILWFDTSAIALGEDEKNNFREQFVGETFGRINKGEAQLTLSLLQIYFQRIGKQRILDDRIDVGIISPYRAQVQYLRRLIKKRPFFKPFRHLISVNTVDGFQGQERDVILVSLVRANDVGQIGFLRDLRRMNVAITRARMKLFILGDAPTMTRHPFYKHLYDYIQSVRQQRP